MSSLYFYTSSSSCVNFSSVSELKNSIAQGGTVFRVFSCIVQLVASLPKNSFVKNKGITFEYAQTHTQTRARASSFQIKGFISRQILQPHE